MHEFRRDKKNQDDSYVQRMFVFVCSGHRITAPTHTLAMEWLFWITALCFILTLILFVALYSVTDLECKWPPCISELIEAHKSLVLIMFGFTSGLVWLNLIILSVIVRTDELVALATLIFLSVVGVIAFDVSNYRLVHYLFVMLYTISSTAFANIVVSDRLYPLTALVNLTTVLFMSMVIYTAMDEEWGDVSKYFYTGFECLWVIAFFVYVIAHAYENRNAYNALLLLIDCTAETTHEKGLHAAIG